VSEDAASVLVESPGLAAVLPPLELPHAAAKNDSASSAPSRCFERVGFMVSLVIVEG
jgi:hypothetical protein